MHGRTYRAILLERFIIRTVPTMYHYPLPVAEPAEIRRVVELYRTAYRIELTYDEAKDVLERVMQFIYLTEVEDALHSAQKLDDSLPKE